MHTVYVVDDDHLILDEIVNTIPWLDNGFEVIGSSTSSAKAIDQIISLKPDVVFTDLKMPDYDGVHLITALQKQNVNCQFIMLSAYSSFDDSRRFFRLDGFDYILKPLQQQEVQIVLERLAAKLSAQNPANTANIDNSNDATDNSLKPLFRELVEFIDLNYQQKHTLDSLSKRFNINPNYICNLFAKNYNSTLTRYITKKRMENALYLMKNTKMAYKQIAIECGYNDYYYFCKMFKEYFGNSPTNYMQNYLQSQLEGAT